MVTIDGGHVDGRDKRLGDSLLELRGINKYFPGVHALEDAQFDVRTGEVHALIGENGAGKSTMIKIISGVYQPDTGEILLDGQRVAFSDPREAHGAGIGTIYQELGLYPELSVAENIFMGHAPTRKRFGFETVDWVAMETQAEAVLAELSIHNLDVGAKVGTLNVGNRQRVEIAKALSLNARILIMDEPTAALTESDVEQLFSIVRLLRERGVSIIYISHRLNEVFELADRVTVLRDGAYIGTQDVADTSEGELISMMVGRTIENLFPKQRAEIGDVVLEVRNLNRPPLTRDISFTVRAGEIVGLAGLVGSGRSETAQVIFGVLPAESGEILLKGVPVKISRPLGSGGARHWVCAGRSRASGADPRDDDPREYHDGGFGVGFALYLRQPRRRAGVGESFDQAVEHPRYGTRADHGQAFGRQSTEGRGEQVVGEQSETADHG